MLFVACWLFVVRCALFVAAGYSLCVIRSVCVVCCLAVAACGLLLFVVWCVLHVVGSASLSVVRCLLFGAS